MEAMKWTWVANRYKSGDIFNQQHLIAFDGTDLFRYIPHY